MASKGERLIELLDEVYVVRQGLLDPAGIMPDSRTMQDVINDLDDLLDRA